MLLLSSYIAGYSEMSLSQEEVITIVSQFYFEPEQTDRQTNRVANIYYFISSSKFYSVKNFKTFSIIKKKFKWRIYWFEQLFFHPVY